MRYKLFLFITFFQINLFAQSFDGLEIPPFHKVTERKIQYPLKDKKMIYPDSLVDIARQNIAQYSSGKVVKNRILKNADYWMEFDYAALSKLITSASVPRAFDLSTIGCPVHGDSIFKVAGKYPWIIDPKHPLQVKCPIGGEVYPSNDYLSYYQSGFSKKTGWDTDYVDDGWGWKSPSGERYWFVAYANQWMWMDYIGQGLKSLGQAYLLTGNIKYASKAIEMLFQIATIYPSMDYENQSRYGLMMKQQNRRYSGKILNLIWETRLITDFAEVYDMIWDRIDQEVVLQRRIGKSGEEIRSFIEANLLEEGIEAIKQKKISGNFGMHQNALITLHLSRQNAGMDKAFHSLINSSSSNFSTMGLRYALYNQVKRDGIPYESPGYNAIWVDRTTSIAENLSKININFFKENRLKRMIDTPLEMVAIGLYTPDVGDGGSVMGGISGRNFDAYHIAYNRYGEDKYIHWINRSVEESFTSFASLFRKPLASIPSLPNNRLVETKASRLFAGYGLGILNNKSDKTAVALTYGKHYSHFHWDFLNFELFANGQKMMPDLGYPDAMNAFISGIYSWSQNTISHNTVVVDAKRQHNNQPGTLHEFADGSFARAMDASSPTYGNTQIYRRNIIMVEIDNEQSYFVDFFNIHGGNRHDYSLHGPPGEVILHDRQWSDTLSGTFAGRDVEIGWMYDNDKLRKEGHVIGYGGYWGSGFQHLFNVQQLESGNGILEFRHSRNKDARLRILLLPDGDQDVFIADAYDKPRGRDHLLKYLIASRKSADKKPLKSTFVSLLAPYKGNNITFKNANLVYPDYGTGHIVVIDRDSLEDVVIYDPEGSKKVLSKYDIETDAVRVVATFKNDKLIRLFFNEGSYFHTKGKQFKSEEIRGKVISVDVKTNSFMVELDKTRKYRPEELYNRVGHFINSFKTTVHPLEKIELMDGKMKITPKDDMLTGRLNISEITKEQLKTNTGLTFTDDYNGTTLLDDSFEPIGIIKNMQRGVMTFKDSSAINTVQIGDEAWICNISIGDEFLIKPLFSWIYK